MASPKKTLLISTLVSSLLSLQAVGENTFGVRDGLHFKIESRAVNIDGSVPTYKNPKASIEARINDLLPRMSLEEKVSQLYVTPLFHSFVSDVFLYQNSGRP